MSTRRRFVTQAVAGLALPFVRPARAAVAGVSDREVLLGQSVVLSGPLGVSLKAFNAGAKIAFDDANARGGVNGRQVRVVTLDDELKPERAVANYKALLEDQKVLAFFGGVGSATIGAVLPLLKDSHAPLIGNYAVSDAVRDKARGAAYFVRASYGREAEKLVQHLATIGISRIAVAHLANPGGEEVLERVRAAIKAQGQAQDVTASAAVKNDGSNVQEGAKTLAASQPQAVIMFLSGPPVSQLMQTVWDGGANPSFYGMSTVAGEAVAKVLGTRMRGLAVSQVTPYPWSDADPQTREFRQRCQATNTDIGYTPWEGYLNAMVMLESLKRAGRDLNRDSLHAAVGSLKLRLAGMDLDYTGSSATGSRYIDLVHVTPEGRFRR